MSAQLEIIRLEDLVAENHSYRKFLRIWDFNKTNNILKKVETTNNHKGYGILRLFKCLLLQFMENLSDREMERYLQENNCAKWFCGFGLSDKTPDHSVFGDVRRRIGTRRLSRIFEGY